MKITCSKETEKKNLGELTNIERQIILGWGIRNLREIKKWKQEEIKGFRKIFKVVTSESYYRRLKRIGKEHNGSKR